jgi:MFS family permease
VSKEAENIRHRHIWVQVLIGMLLMISAMAFGRMAYGVVMPFMLEDMSLTYVQAGMLGTAIALGYLGMVIFAGMLAARWGMKQIVLLGGGTLAVSMLGLVLAPSYGWAFALLMMAGVGTALVFTPLVSLLVAWYPERKGLVIGFLTSGVGIGMLIVGLVVPMAMDTFTEWRWRAVWGIFGCYTLSIVILGAFLLKNPAQTTSNGQSVKYTKKELNSYVYKNKGVITIALIYFFIGMAYLIPTTFHMGFMLKQQITSVVAGNIIAINGILSIFSGPIWGYFSDRFGRRAALILSLWLMAFGTVIPILLTNTFGFLASQVIIGCTMGGMLAQIQASATEVVPPPLIAVSLGYVTVFFASGQLFGPGIAGWIIDHLGGFPAAYSFSVMMMMVSIGFAYKIKKTNVNQPVVVSSQDAKTM